MTPGQRTLGAAANTHLQKQPPAVREASTLLLQHHHLLIDELQWFGRNAVWQNLMTAMQRNAPASTNTQTGPRLPAITLLSPTPWFSVSDHVFHHSENRTRCAK